MGERKLENAFGVISSQDGLRSGAGCGQRSGAPPYPPARWSRIPRTDDNKAEGWRLARGRGPEHKPPFLLSLRGPQLLQLGKIDRVEKAKLAGKATWWVKIPAEEQFSPELGRGWFSGKNVL